jgi:hypothetical protein
MWFVFGGLAAVIHPLLWLIGAFMAPRVQPV